MAQEIKVAYNDGDKAVVGIIGAEIDTSVEIEPALAKKGVSVASEILSFEDDVTITNDMVNVSADGVATKA
tara:strand:- start:25 stop:237 length:213 start_codon:yes stop_codon:yes gene_type:complete